MKTRAVFLVHGVGTQKKGEFFEQVTEPMMDFLRAQY